MSRLHTKSDRPGRYGGPGYCLHCGMDWPCDGNYREDADARLAAPRAAARDPDKTSGSSDPEAAVRLLDVDACRDALDAQAALLVCYRVGKRPSGQLLDRVGKANELRAALAASPEPAEGLDVSAAYAERNSLVAALAHLFANAAWRGIDPTAPEFTVVYIDLPTGQVSWHVPDTEMEQFPPLPLRDPTGWDGHDTSEKYRRLAAMRRGDICRDVQEAVERTIARLQQQTEPAIRGEQG